MNKLLRVIGLTHGRFHAWNQEEWDFEDARSCPKSLPQQLTAKEVSVIRDMVTSYVLLMPQLDLEVTDGFQLHFGGGVGLSRGDTMSLVALRAIYSR